MRIYFYADNIQSRDDSLFPLKLELYVNCYSEDELSLHSAEETDVVVEDDKHDDEEDDDEFPSMIIITLLFSPGVPSTKILNISFTSIIY